MSLIHGQSIETVASLDAPTRNRVMAALVDLTLQEMFVFGVTQSDPNFASHLYDASTGKIVLLDFGASRDLDAGVTRAYRDMLRAGRSRMMATSRHRC